MESWSKVPVIPSRCGYRKAKAGFWSTPGLNVSFSNKGLAQHQVYSCLAMGMYSVPELT